MKPNIQKQSLGSFLTLSQQQTQHHETKYLNKNTLPASPIHDTCLEVWYQQCMDMLIKQHSDLKTKTNNIPNHYSNFIQSKCEKKNFEMPNNNETFKHNSRHQTRRIETQYSIYIYKYIRV
jgi:hypothetical protein